MADSGALGRLYRDGDVICRQGDLDDCMYFVRSGQVEVLQRRGEQEFCLGVLGTGDFFGETGLFERGVRPATVRALGDVYVLTIERQNLIRRVHEDSSIVFRMMEKMLRRIRELEEALIRTANTGRVDLLRVNGVSAGNGRKPPLV